ncbi:SDR family NAD(P)-dependent oxidoreductase [Burkholderia multivorans]|uniref:SDR family NAD(P)-dependent oxidoreductase n=1 Tax=Burkholderia multivorans TaxID=87883 RepID=UPI000D01E609|nr:SDR family oxidoreductase [Burkholderia multivorans]PRH45571.1 short-chain dehydrogenase [Burkholderia multivorans]
MQQLVHTPDHCVHERHPSDLFDLTGKVALVTGASSGIGKAIATEMAAAGARVMLAGLDGEGCERVAHELTRGGAQTQAFQCDVTDAPRLASLVEAVEQKWGAIDVLVCNAGVAPHFGPIASATDEHYELTMNVNLRSVLKLTSLVLPGMADRRSGSVIIMSSIAGLRGNRMLGLYGLSKAGSAELARNLAVEWGPFNVRVNAISPGVIETAFAAPIASDASRAAARKISTPLRRFGAPRDVAGAAVFLASEAAAFVTGHNLVVDGGTTIGDS